VDWFIYGVILKAANFSFFMLLGSMDLKDASWSSIEINIILQSHEFLLRTIHVSGKGGKT
jgi:hypothetical protein